MAQGKIGGATDYSNQSQQQILDDVKYWIRYTSKIKDEIANLLSNVQNTSIWANVPYNYKTVFCSSVYYFDVIINDLIIVKTEIEKNCVTKREVSLLRKIGKKSNEYNREYGLYYHEDERYWHRYGEPDFSVIEKMYNDGRDFFVTLQDASNAASRLEDYMQTGNITNFSIGGDVSGSQIQVGTVNSSQNMVNGATEFPYEEVLNILTEISKYKGQINEEFEENGTQFCVALDLSIEETNKKGNPEKIKKLVNIMKEVAARVSTGLIVEGVKSLIAKLPL